jgi:hypothetical protein
MEISFANQQINLKPIVPIIIGTKGQIDMEGARGRVQFILANKDSKGVKINTSISHLKKSGGNSEHDSKSNSNLIWKIVSRKSDRISFEEFNEENFFNALMEIAND